MALWIVNDALGSQVQKDLRAIYPFPGMTITAKTGSFSVLEVLVVNPPTPSIIATLVATVAAAPATVTIQGSMSNRVIGSSGGTSVPISSVGGLTVPDRFPGPFLINILYDCEAGLGCRGRGRMNAPTDVVLFHELVHAFHFITNGFSGNPKNTAETDALPIENQYRTGRTPTLPPRNSHSDGQCNDGPPTTTKKESCKSCSCFTGDTRVTLIGGDEKPIERIHEGDFVLGQSGQPNRVIGIERPILGDRKLYALNGSSPFITAEHPIMTTAGWKSIDPAATTAENPQLIVKRLMVKDFLLQLKGCAVSVGFSAREESVQPEVESLLLHNIEAQCADPDTQLYNLLLDGDHTYFANGFLVHNKCFIATAVLDTAYESRLDQLRLFRDSTIPSTQRAAAYIEAFYSCYRNIGSQIAEEIEGDTEERKSILAFVVMPVVSYLTLAIRCPEQPLNIKELPPAWGDFFSEMMRGLECWAISAMPPQIEMPADDIEFVSRYVLRQETSRVAFRESLMAGKPTPDLNTLISNASIEFSCLTACAKDLRGMFDRSKGGENRLALMAGTLLKESAIKDLERLRSAFSEAGLSHIFDTAFIVPLVNFVKLCVSLPEEPAPVGLPDAWRDVLACLRGDWENLIKLFLSSLTLTTSVNAASTRPMNLNQEANFQHEKS